MYLPSVGGVYTVLSQPYNPTTDATIHVVDTSKLPDAPNLLTIINDEKTYLITVKYLVKNSSGIAGLTFIESTPGGQTYTYSTGSTVSRPITVEDFRAIQNNIRDLDAKKLDIYFGTIYSGKYLVVGDDGNITTTTQIPTTASFATLEGQPEDNVLLALALKERVKNDTKQTNYSVGYDDDGLYVIT